MLNFTELPAKYAVKEPIACVAHLFRFGSRECFRAQLRFMEGLGGEAAPHFQTSAGGENFLSQQWLMALFPVKTVVKSIG